MKVATFDCYGTLVDWEGGAATFLHAIALRCGDEEQRGTELRERWEEIQFEVIQGPYRPYKEVLADSLALWAEDQEYALDDGDAGAFVRAMRSWQPFPDTRLALVRTRAAGVRLVIVSNTDRDIISHTVRQLDVPFDAIVTAEDVGAYKPADPPFERALEVAGVPAEEVLHVAFGFKYDIGPAKRHGMGSAWVNRHGDAAPGSERPDHEWRDLRGLVKLAGG